MIEDAWKDVSENFSWGDAIVKGPYDTSREFFKAGFKAALKQKTHNPINCGKYDGGGERQAKPLRELTDNKDLAEHSFMAGYRIGVQDQAANTVDVKKLAVGLDKVCATIRAEKSHGSLNPNYLVVRTAIDALQAQAAEIERLKTELDMSEKRFTSAAESADAYRKKWLKSIYGP